MYYKIDCDAYNQSHMLLIEMLKLFKFCDFTCLQRKFSLPDPQFDFPTKKIHLKQGSFFFQ